MEWARACPKRSQAVWTLSLFFFPSSNFVFGAYFNSGMPLHAEPSQSGPLPRVDPYPEQCRKRYAFPFFNFCLWRLLQ